MGILGTPVFLNWPLATLEVATRAEAARRQRGSRRSRQLVEALAEGYDEAQVEEEEHNKAKVEEEEVDTLAENCVKSKEEQMNGSQGLQDFGDTASSTESWDKDDQVTENHKVNSSKEEEYEDELGLELELEEEEMNSFLQKEGVNPTEAKTKVKTNKKEIKGKGSKVKEAVVADSEHNCIAALLKKVTMKKETKMKELKKVEIVVKKLKVACLILLLLFLAFFLFFMTRPSGGAEACGGGVGGGGGGGGEAGQWPVAMLRREECRGSFSKKDRKRPIDAIGILILNHVS